MTKIETFVFFDLETSGFPWEESNRTKIIELSMVVAKRNHILECKPGETPRIMNKLSLCLNPRRMIQMGSTKVTGLCNDLLEHESSFNKTVADTICNFLSIYTKPISLVAHNGNRFDYPIFKAEFIRQEYSLPEDLLCTDSYLGFKDVIGQLKKDSKHFLYAPDLSPNLIAECIKETKLDPDIENFHNSDSKDLMDNLNFTEIDKICEVEYEENGYYVGSQSVNEKTPEKVKPNGHVNVKMPIVRNKARRNLKFNQTVKESYKMKDIYERLLGKKPVECHRAEADCLLLLESVIVVGKEFVEWADSHCKLLKDMPTMQVGRKYLS